MSRKYIKNAWRKGSEDSFRYVVLIDSLHYARTCPT